jgi:hypothetical protein
VIRRSGGGILAAQGQSVSPSVARALRPGSEPHTAGGSRAQEFYYRIVANNYPSGTPSLGEFGNLDGGSGVWTFCPAIGGNARGDVCVVYSQSSASQNPTVMCTLRRAEDAVFVPAIPLKPSPNAYSGVTGSNHRARWGDFAAVSTDPEDGSFWVVQEWVRSAGGDDWSCKVLPVFLL